MVNRSFLLFQRFFLLWCLPQIAVLGDTVAAAGSRPAPRLKTVTFSRLLAREHINTVLLLTKLPQAFIWEVSYTVLLVYLRTHIHCTILGPLWVLPRMRVAPWFQNCFIEWGGWRPIFDVPRNYPTLLKRRTYHNRICLQISVVYI